MSWGDNSWGYGYWGNEYYDRIEDDRNISEAVAEWDSAIEFAPESTMYRLVDALLAEADRIDANLEEIYEQQHVASATGDDLDQFGRLVDVDRETGESDDKYRARIKAAFRASTISATWDEYVEFAASVLSTDVDNLNFRTNYGGLPANVNVGAQPEVYESLDLTSEEVAELLGRGVPAGHEVTLLEGGTFRLKADGENDDASAGLTADGIDTGGTLAEDLV
jgi:hypothetical protein